LRAAGQPTLPSTLGAGAQINPFLRTASPVIRAATAHLTPTANDETGVFAAIRQWKNEFK
jgi:hydroxyacylglutathione hydrolase